MLSTNNELIHLNYKNLFNVFHIKKRIFLQVSIIHRKDTHWSAIQTLISICNFGLSLFVRRNENFFLRSVNLSRALLVVTLFVHIYKLINIPCSGKKANKTFIFLKKNVLIILTGFSPCYWGHSHRIKSLKSKVISQISDMKFHYLKRGFWTLMPMLLRLGKWLNDIDLANLWRATVLPRKQRFTLTRLGVTSHYLRVNQARVRHEVPRLAPHWEQRQQSMPVQSRGLIPMTRWPPTYHFHGTLLRLHVRNKCR